MKLARTVQALLVLAVMLAAWTVWPTLYRYERSGGDLLRINRLTGKTWEYMGQGLWFAAGEVSGLPRSDPNAMAPAPVPLDTSVNPFLKLSKKKR